MSKGSGQRPTDKAKYDKGYDAVFSKPAKKPKAKAVKK